MITVTLVSNDGSGLPVQVPVVENTTLEKFLEVSFDGNPDEFTIRVRANGTSVDAHKDYVLQDGDRISLAPIKVEGETRGPGTNEEQIQTLKKGMGASCVEEAYIIVNKYDPDVITLAYKLMRARVTKDKLPKAVDKLISNLSKEDAEMVRSKFVQIKS